MAKKATQFKTIDKSTLFGLHLMLDAYEADPERLADMKRVFNFLNTLPELIQMNKLTAPSVINADATEAGKDPGGISGTVIIAESHISIHTFADKGFFTMDVYSCSNFEDQIPKILEYTQKEFKYGYKELQLVTRGAYYPL